LPPILSRREVIEMLTHGTPRYMSMAATAVLACVAFLLAACAPSTPTQASVPPTVPPVGAATDTLPPPTERPTEIPTETAIPQPELGPEEPATSSDQVSGKWAIRFMGGGGGDAGLLILAEDGTFRMDATAGEHAGMNLGYGTFHFDGDALLLESDACLIPGPTDQFFTCTATYHVFVSMADGKPALLRFTAVDDPFVDRKKTLDGKAFKPYVEG
jgi:hypothetical protein